MVQRISFFWNYSSFLMALYRWIGWASELVNFVRHASHDVGKVANDRANEVGMDKRMSNEVDALNILG